MKTNARLLVLAVGVGLASGVGAIGCGSADSQKWPAPEGLSQGLTVLSADATTSVRAAFKKADRVVYFEAVRGEKMNDFYAKAYPHLGGYEMDARFVDARGHAYIVQRGGDRFVDPSWAKDMDRKVSYDPADVPLAAELADAMQLDPVAATATYHARAALGLGHAMERETAAVKHMPMQNGIAPTDYYTAPGSATIHIHYEPLGGLLGVFGDHSSTHTVSGSWNLYSCNHGDCANNISYGYSCYTGAGWNQLSVEMRTDLGVGGACYTPYDWNGGSGGHNCHSDSVFEEEEIQWWGVPDRYTGACSGLNYWNAPGDGNPCP